MRCAVWLSCAVLLWSAPAARAQWPRMNEKLTAKKVAIRTVVLLPAQITFNRIGVKGPEGGLPEADQIAGSFCSAVAKELSARGVEVLPYPLEQAKDDAARFAVADLQARYDNVAVQVRRKRDGVVKGRFTLGDGVAKFQPGAAADAVVFIRGSGYLLTPGRRAIGAATWGLGGVMPAFQGEVSFVDARTGEVLVYVRFLRQKDMTKKQDERFGENMREAFHYIPFPLPPPKK